MVILVLFWLFSKASVGVDNTSILTLEGITLSKVKLVNRVGVWCICFPDWLSENLPLNKSKILCRQNVGLLDRHMYMLQVKSNLRSICFNLGQFDFFVVFAANQKIFLAPSIFSSSSFFSLSPLYLPHLLFPPLLSQHPSPYSFYLNAYRMSLEPPTFGFPLDSCPDALPLSHGDLDASSTIFF